MSVMRTHFITTNITLLWLISMMCLMHSCAAHKPAPLVQAPAGKPVYALFGWRESGGAWTFSLLPGWISGRFTMEELLHSKLTVEALELEMSKMAPGSILVWSDELQGREGVKRIGYPEGEVIERVRRKAESLHLEVDGPP
jgi:hypothetical protein